MKKVLFFLLSVILLGIGNVYAASDCSYEEQAKFNSEVANIKAKYEEATKKRSAEGIECQDGTKDCITEEVLQQKYFKISILNLSENFYIVATNDRNSDTRTIRYSDLKDGIYTFDLDDISNITKFDFKIYASDKTHCQNELYRTMNLTTPRYNYFSEFGDCKDNPDYYLCEKYVTFDYMSPEEFNQKIAEYKKKNETKEDKKETKGNFEKIKDFINKNKTVILISIGVLIIICGTAAFIIIRRKKKSVL